METKPGFFKYFLPRNATRMLIPSPFMDCIGGSLPKKIFFRDQYLNLWRVKTLQVGENWYFKNGWEKFVKHNKILPRDILVFDYVEEDLFNIKIFDPNGCETKGAGKHVSMDIDDETEDEDDDSEEVDRVLERQEDLFEESEHDDDEIEDADYSPNQENKVAKDLAEESEDDNDKIEGSGGNTKRNRRTPRPLYPKYYGIEIFEKGLIKQPRNAYFVTIAKAKRTFDLFIPLPLIEDHKLDLPKPKMLLVDPRGREFHGKYKRWTDGRIAYSGQWKLLLRMNDVGIGDTCICEFMKGAKDLYLNVSFLRTRTSPN